jgi:hypothetical protein
MTLADNPALKLRQARDTIAAQTRERVRLEQQVRKLTLDLTRARHIIVTLQRQAQTRAKESADAGAVARSEASPRP